MRPSRRLGFSGWRPLVVAHDDPWEHRIQRTAAANSVASFCACRASRRACQCQQLLGHARAIQPRDMYLLYACRRNRDLALGDATCIRSSRRRVSLRGACAAFCGAEVAEGAGPRVILHLLGTTLSLLHLRGVERPGSWRRSLLDLGRVFVPWDWCRPGTGVHCPLWARSATIGVAIQGGLERARG